MNFTLKNGEEVEIKELQQTSVNARQFLNYFAPILREKPRPFLQVNSVPSLKQEEKWLKDKKKNIAKKKEAMLIALHDGEIVGSADARKGPYIDEDKAMIGISVARKYRGQGLGKKLLTKIIKLSKKMLRPKIIYLTAVADNVAAVSLYKKLGFEKVAALPKWQKHRGKYREVIYMVLK